MTVMVAPSRPEQQGCAGITLIIWPKMVVYPKGWIHVHAPIVCTFGIYTVAGVKSVVLSGTTRLTRERQQSAEGIYCAPKMEQASLEVTESILTSTSFTVASLWRCFVPTCHFW